MVGTSHDGVTWADLDAPARAFRVAHATWGALNIAALVWLWQSALFRRRGRPAALATGLLLSEGAALVIGRGDCPFGPFQARLGDPVPMFEWFLPPKAAKAAVPILSVVALLTLAAVLVRPPANRAKLEVDRVF